MGLIRKRKLDLLDVDIINLLQEEGDLSLLKLSEKTGGSHSTVLRRVADLKRRGVIEAIEARVNYKAVGYQINAMIYFYTNVKFESKLIDAITSHSTIKSAHKIQPTLFSEKVSVKYICNVIVKTDAHLNEVLEDVVSIMGGNCSFEVYKIQSSSFSSLVLDSNDL
jgi:DNA-binding Lrp family transcriptional regulator